MNKLITLFLVFMIIISLFSLFITFTQEVLSLSSIPEDPYFIGARYSSDSRLRATSVSAIIRVPNGPFELSHYIYIHYYVLLNVHNYNPNNPYRPQYWYQLGIDGAFTVIGGTYDYYKDDFYPCNNSGYPLSAGYYKFTIKMEGMKVVFTVEQLTSSGNIVIWSCPQRYALSPYLVLDSGYSVFEEVRANQTYEIMPAYSFYFTSLSTNNIPEFNWSPFRVTNNPKTSPIPPNAMATIMDNNVLIQNYYNRKQFRNCGLGETPFSSVSATGGSSKNIFLITWRSISGRINIGQVTYKDPVDLNSKYFMRCETLATLNEYTSSVPAITYSPYTGKYYLAWRGYDDKIYVMQSFDGRIWFNKVTLNEFTRNRPSLTVGDSYIYLAWVDLNGKINIIRSQDGTRWTNKITLNEVTSRPVGIAYLAYPFNSLVVAWVGSDNRINIIKYSLSRGEWYDRVTLNERSWSGLSLTVISDPYTGLTGYTLYLVWREGDILNSIRSGASDLGRRWGFKMVFDESRIAEPFIASNDDKLFVTYSSSDYIFLLRTTR